MKQYTKLGINENLELARTNKDKFFVHAKNRLAKLAESGDYNDNVAGLFRDGLLESSKDQFLERFYVSHKGDYRSLIESFDKFTETRGEQHSRFVKILEGYRTSVQDNPHFPANHNVLKEAVCISKTDTLLYLINEGCKIAHVLDVSSKLNSKLYESSGAEQACLVIKDDPKYVLGLAESLSRAIQFTLAQPGHITESLHTNTTRFLESLNNIYSIYKEGMDLVQTQETQASELFLAFLTGRANSYYFQVDNLQKVLKDPAAFVQTGMYYFQHWIEDNIRRLSYKFTGDTFTRLRDMVTYFDAAHAMVRTDENFKPEFYTFDRMYKLLDVILGVSQILRMDLRNLVCKYITTIRPLIDSYRTDFMRGPVRTGF